MTERRGPSCCQRHTTSWDSGGPTLPVIQASKLELVLNLNPAKELARSVSPNFLARAEEVIR